ncbi:MAG TPA: RNA polymerase sigma factor [Bacteroidales bacterium]|nr:RNA polymerase sigma factor [Bacteroidales bacterium]
MKIVNLMSQQAEAEILSLMQNPLTKDQGFLLLMNTYQKPLYWHIRRLVVTHEDAEDLLQETFILVYSHIASFKGDSRLYTWLYRIATNECNRHFRRKESRIQREELLTDQTAELAVEPELENSDDILVKFQKAIQQLPNKQKIVFNLRYYEELPYEDIAQILHTTVGTLRTSYHFAFEKIKNYLSEHD